MRVVRFPARPTRVADDIRAALTSLGRGGNVVGGVAVLGVTPPESDLEVDAVLVLPRGVFVVVGVDLPDPAMTLTAPLHQEWKADGWPLVRPGQDGDGGGDASARPTVNPGLAALALAGRFADRIHAVDSAIPVGVVIAVGPYVETVEQPPDDLAGPVRILYPTASAFMKATDALPAAARPLTTTQARAVLRDLAPTATDLDDATLSAEGFAATQPTSGEPPTPPPSGTPPTARSVRIPPAPPSPATQHQHRDSPRRRVALAGAALLVVVVVAITILTVSSREAPTPASVEESAGGVATVDVGGVPFSPVAKDAATRCEPHHAVGDVQAFLLDHGCVELLRGSFTTTVDGRTVSVSVGAVTFPDAEVADRFEELAAGPGTGVLTDIATEAGRWAHSVPTFEGATYTTRRDGATVRTVLAQVEAGADETPAQDSTSRVAQAALDLPLR